MIASSSQRFAAYAILLFIVAASLTGCRGRKGESFVDAAYSGNVREVQRLLDQGVDPNFRARDGWTALTTASREGRLTVVEVLLQRGANVNLSEGGGHTALYWARKYHHTRVERALLAAGAEDK